MKAIKITEKSGTIILFNPRFVTGVKLVKGEYNQDWCIVITLAEGAWESNTYTILYSDSEYNKCMNMFEYIKSCMNSID